MLHGMPRDVVLKPLAVNQQHLTADWRLQDLAGNSWDVHAFMPVLCALLVNIPKGVMTEWKMKVDEAPPAVDPDDFLAELFGLRSDLAQ